MKNEILRLLFDQWEENRLDGKAESLAHSHLCNSGVHTVSESNTNYDLLSAATLEVAERAFLAGFNTAVELRDLLDGKATRDDN